MEIIDTRGTPYVKPPQMFLSTTAMADPSVAAPAKDMWIKIAGD